MYKFIVNPNTNRKVSIFNKKGNQILNEYIKISQYGGHKEECSFNEKTKRCRKSGKIGDKFCENVDGRCQIKKTVSEPKQKEEKAKTEPKTVARKPKATKSKAAEKQKAKPKAPATKPNKKTLTINNLNNIDRNDFNINVITTLFNLEYIDENEKDYKFKLIDTILSYSKFNSLKFIYNLLHNTVSLSQPQIPEGEETTPEVEESTPENEPSLNHVYQLNINYHELFNK